jgi:hypothetical protein
MVAVAALGFWLMGRLTVWRGAHIADKALTCGLLAVLSPCPWSGKYHREIFAPTEFSANAGCASVNDEKSRRKVARSTELLWPKNQAADFEEDSANQAAEIRWTQGNVASY